MHGAGREMSFLYMYAQAMEIAETKDRMHLKTTYYAYAKHSEEMGEISAATTRCVHLCVHLLSVCVS